MGLPVALQPGGEDGYDELGRDLVGGPVSERERAFAAYALGLIARENESPARAGIALALVASLIARLHSAGLAMTLSPWERSRRA